MAAQVNVTLDNNVFRALTLTERYEDKQGLFFIFDEMNLPDPERRRIVNNGITSIDALAEQFCYNVEGFESHLLQLNKTFATSTDAELCVF